MPIVQSMVDVTSPASAACELLLVLVTALHDLVRVSQLKAWRKS
jgi:hypothetical protein